MTTQPPSYDEWRKRYSFDISSAAQEELHATHGTDAENEIEQALRRKYDFYIAQEFGHD